jgi:hypothetical protein
MHPKYPDIKVKAVYPRKPFELLKQFRRTKEYWYMTPEDYVQIYNALNPRPSRFFPRDQPWILRNLTTKEFVRSESIAVTPSFISGPQIKYIGFGEALVSRICWQSTPQRYGIDRGIWAGHCFEITTLARHKRDTKQEEWKDVSGEVANDIARMWESGRCPNWRDWLLQLPHCPFKWD